jgi:hypothetical protein
VHVEHLRELVEVAGREGAGRIERAEGAQGVEQGHDWPM